MRSYFVRSCLRDKHVLHDFQNKVCSSIFINEHAFPIFETFLKSILSTHIARVCDFACLCCIRDHNLLLQGLMQHHKEIVEYFNTRGVSTIFLFRRNLLRRMISILANSYDRDAKPLNGTHKSHVHSPHEAAILASYKPVINATTLIPSLRQVEETTKKGLEYFKSTRHIIVYYEDVVKNHTVRKMFQKADLLVWL
ncbi:hypothetical protein Golax_004845 [Gossypium laxum]|uniref:Uncharacterized protein n=1 Tax=Gossypium laxum TaxID=34288 RepID=A0A7J8ZYW5_9ROSI|nr:hypothetical protein [Gossypium laxum]